MSQHDPSRTLPGMTQFESYTFPSTNITLNSNENPKTILIATQIITDENIFLNGLFQNILILYDMLETLGFSCYLLVNVPSKSYQYDQGSILKRYKYLVPEEILLHPMKIHMYIEIGMSVSPPLREYLCNQGAKIVKLYLGNIMNIDIETIQMTPGMMFPHHVVGKLDEIWTSPHYGQNREYAAVLNHVDIKNSKIAHYVWEPTFITRPENSASTWCLTHEWKKRDIVIIEPNISFQKSYFFPLVLANAFAERNPEWKGNVYVLNAAPIVNNVHAKYNMMSRLVLGDRLKLIQDRKNIIQITREYPSAFMICHQYNNDFNYMLLELMYLGFPVLHTSFSWKLFGYYWSEQELEKSLTILKNGMENHHINSQKYLSQSRELYWHHSIHNPENKRKWMELIS